MVWFSMVQEVMQCEHQAAATKSAHSIPQGTAGFLVEKPCIAIRVNSIH